MIPCSLDASQPKPRCHLGRKDCLSCNARSLSKALAPGDLRRERQKQLVDHICGQKLAKDCRPSFMEKQAYPEFIGENLQHSRGSCGNRFAG